MNQVWKFATSGAIHFGRGSIDRLIDEVHRFGLHRLIVVSDPIVLKLPQVMRAIESLRTQCQIECFNGGMAEPSINVALRAWDVARSIQSDGVVGIGGGSNMDVAKIVAIMLKFGGTPQDYFGFDRIPGPVVPVIAVPTTAGTGSEVSHSAVLTDTDAQVKVSTLSPYLRPNVAIVDPALTDSCPATVTAHSGIDALVHAIEALTNRPNHELDSDGVRAYEGSYPFTQMLALESIRQVHAYLERAVRSPDDRDARDGMAYAALLAGMAFSNSGVGLVHALEYPIGALTHCSHGEGNGLLLPYVMRFNEPACQAVYRRLASLFLGKPEAECQSLEAIEAIERLQQKIGIRNKLSQLGLRSDQLEIVADKALQIERLMSITARRPTKEDMLDILLKAM